MNYRAYQQGFSLVELMIATLLGLVVCYSVLQVYLSQWQLYKTSNSQSLILSDENAIINLLSPTIRSAGFLGCGVFNSVYSNLNAGLPDPLGSINTKPVMIAGYNGSGATFAYNQINPVNDASSSNWTPSLPASLIGLTEKGSDVIIVLGAMPSTYPIGITQIDPSMNSFSVQSTANSTIASGQLGAVSDCSKSIIFQVTSVGATSISHAAGGGSMQNSSATFPIGFLVGSQFIQVQQTAFFIGQGQGGDSALMRGILNGGAWTVEPLVSGVEFMKVQYGIGDNGLITQYVTADEVTDWSKVYAVRLGFLLAGKIGSGSTNTNYSVLDTAVTVPGDNLLRHTFEMTINLRNSI